MDPVTPSQGSSGSPSSSGSGSGSGSGADGEGRAEGEEDPTDLLIRIDPAEISTSSLPLGGGEQLPPGTLLGEYRLEALIGQGGMGYVYAATHPVIGKRAAVKVLRKELCREPLEVQRFIDEARIVNRIGHPNIVDVFAFGQTPDGRSYFVMEWLKGESLRARVSRSRLELDEIRAIVKSLASALSAAHEHGVIHRDLKPDNVFLVDVPGHGMGVKLLDFGIAKLVTAPHRVAQTASNAMVGTPQYIAPEQAKALAIDHRADTYAFGAILFELLTGRPPFLATSVMEVVAMHLMEPPPRPSAFAPVPPEIDDLVVAMMAKSPDARPEMVEVAARFERTRWLERTSVHAAHDGAQAVQPTADATIQDDVARLIGRRVRPRTLALIAAALVLVLAAVVLLFRKGDPSGSRDADPASASASPDPAGDPRGSAVTVTPIDPSAPSRSSASSAPPAPDSPAPDLTAAPAGGKLDGASTSPAPAAGSTAAGSTAAGSGAPSPRTRTPRPIPPPPRPPVTDSAPPPRALKLVVDAPEFIAKIDGKRVGPSIQLPPGKYRLWICAHGKRPYEREIEIKSADLTWRVELEPLRDSDLQCRP